MLKASPQVSSWSAVLLARGQVSTSPMVGRPERWRKYFYRSARLCLSDVLGALRGQAVAQRPLLFNRREFQNGTPRSTPQRQA